MTVLESTARVLAQAARELLCLTTEDGRVVGAAGPWPEAFGRTPDALAGTAIADLVEPADRPALSAYYAATVAGATHPPIDVRATYGARRVYDVALRAVDGSVVASFRDVTQQRRAEELLRQLNADLRRSNDELQRFAYVASHDLSEPLRMVTSYCALLADDCGDRLTDDGREYLAFAVDGAKRMRTLIDDLLAYSRVSWVSEEATRVDLDAVFAQAAHDLGPLIAANGVEVTVGPLPAVLGDAGQLRQLASNLVGNAVKFASPDRPPRVSVTARTTGSQVTLSVTDNGIGIEEKHRERIFVMFKRLHGRAAYDGNGIGLALCKRIAELHGGDVWAEGAPGGGSVFRVTLVAAPDVVEVPA
ncbi:MAG TPA: ATP-binding protein [Mycobacteriales bacterium]|jgi:signal transduction histidine kinase